MWKIFYALDENNVRLDKSRRDSFVKKHPEAVALLDARLQQVMSSLNGGLPVNVALNRGWIHPELAGVFAICVREPALRLYFLPIPQKQLLVVLNLGGKNRQSADVNEAAEWARQINDSL